jgi:RimJ/RimL family protein N-acetyltransferase
VTDATGKPVPRPRDAAHARLAPPRGEIGYWLVPAARGQGTGKRRVAAGDWAFARSDLERLEITTTPENAAARRSRSRSASSRRASCGPQLERGRRVDIVLLARLRK